MNGLVETFNGDHGLVEAVTGTAAGECDWMDVLVRLIPRIPRMFFSSLR
jgi:hypothetical protein